MYGFTCMTLFDLPHAQEVSSEHYYSPLDEATISYTKLLEKVSLIVILVIFMVSLLMSCALAILIYACVCELRINRRTSMATWRSIFNQPRERMNSMTK